MAKRFDVLAVGLQVIDLLIMGADEGLFSRETSFAQSVQLLMGGDALNQAVTLSMLGGRIGLMGAVGNDRLGEVLISQLSGYPIELIEQRLDCPTTVSVVLCRPDGQRSFIVQKGHNHLFSYRHIDEQAVRDAKILSVGSCMALPALDGADTIRLLDLARSAGTISAMDIKINGSDYDMPPILESFRHVDYLLPSEADVRTLTGVEDDPARMAEALHDMGVKNLVIKLGERGCYLSADGVDMAVPAFPARSVDTTGAGDTFAGAFLHALCRGWDAETCARFANAAGAIAVETPGACGAIRSEAQVLERMRRNA